ncbi:MAG: recombination mediator RecR [Caulobacteraceae bacterium]
MAASAGPEIERLVTLLAKLPGLGRRSARRAALALLKRREDLLIPLGEALAEAAEKVRACSLCGALDTVDPCAICADPERDAALICVVEDMGALWALERAGAYRGRYHVLGGLLAPMEGVGPEALRIEPLRRRAHEEGIQEVILALPATVDGQTTAHYLSERLAGAAVMVSHLARGVPVGGDLDWLDDGTINQAMRARRPD